MDLGEYDNFITVPLSDFMFVVRNLWLDESSKYNFTEARDKIKNLLNFLDLGSDNNRFCTTRPFFKNAKIGRTQDPR